MGRSRPRFSKAIFVDMVTKSRMNLDDFKKLKTHHFHMNFGGFVQKCFFTLLGSVSKYSNAVVNTGLNPSS